MRLCIYNSKRKKFFTIGKRWGLTYCTSLLAVRTISYCAWPIFWNDNCIWSPWRWRIFSCDKTSSKLDDLVIEDYQRCSRSYLKVQSGQISSMELFKRYFLTRVNILLSYCPNTPYLYICTSWQNGICCMFNLPEEGPFQQRINYLLILI